MKVSFYSKERFEFWKDFLPYLDELEVIEGLVNWIILSFYKLDDECVMEIDRERRKKYDLEDEPINWGSLGVTSVEQLSDGTFLVHIEEANSRKFENFIEEQMRKWGWKVKCETSW